MEDSVSASSFKDGWRKICGVCAQEMAMLLKERAPYHAVYTQPQHILK
jgi:hypothetical protein